MNVSYYDFDNRLRDHIIEFNREHIGKTGDELVSMWNADNPTDRVE